MAATMISRSKLAYSVTAGFLLAWIAAYFLEGGIAGPSARYDSTRFQAVAGTGVLTQSGFEVTSAAPNGQAMVVVELPESIDASDFPQITFKAPGLESAAGAGLFFITAAEPTRGFPIPLTLEQVRAGSVALDSVPNWRGEIIRIGFVVQGPWPQPVVFRELGLVPLERSLGALVTRVSRQWVQWSGWDGGAVNFYIGADRSERRLTPLVFTSLWVLFAALIYLAWRGEQRRLVIVSLILGGWLLLDLRWQVDLWQRHGADEPDPALLADERRRALLTQLKESQLGQRPDARVFIISADTTGYSVYRTRYHLGATQTSFGLDRLPSANERREGDFLIVFGLRDKLEYSRSRGVIESSTEIIPVDLIANSPETGGIFRIRAGS
jgi:hypothetical protein